MPGLLLIVEKQLGANTLAGDARCRGGAREPEAGARRHRGRFAPSSGPRRSSRCRWRISTAALILGCVLVVLVLIVFLADWRTALDQQRRDSAVAARRGLVPALSGRHVRHDGARRSRHRPRRGRRRRDHRRREHRAAAAAEPRGGQRRGRRLQVVLEASRRSPQRCALRDADRHRGVLPGLHASRGFRARSSGRSRCPTCYAILASLLVALTITPAMALLLLTGKGARAIEPAARACAEAPLRAAARAAIIDRPGAVAALSLATLLAGDHGGGALPRVRSCCPNFRETDFLMHWVEKPGASVEASTRITERASHELHGDPRRRGTSARTSAVRRSPTRSSARISPSSGSASTRRSTTTRRSPKVQAVVDGYPGLKRDLLTYLRERIKEVLTGASATVVVRHFRPGHRAASGACRGREAGARGRRRHDGHSGAVTDPGAAGRSAVSAGSRGAVRADAGRRPARRRRRSSRARRSASSTISNASSASSSGARPELRQQPGSHSSAAHSRPRWDATCRSPPSRASRVAPALSEVTREGGSRKIDVTCNVARSRSRDRSRVTSRPRLRQLSFGDGYHAEVLGEYAVRQDISDSAKHAERCRTFDRNWTIGRQLLKAREGGPLFATLAARTRHALR